MAATLSQDTLIELGELDKVKEYESVKRQYPDVFKFLNTLYNYDFSETGKSNICRRFSIPPEILKNILEVYKSGGR